MSLETMTDAELIRRTDIGVPVGSHDECAKRFNGLARELSIRYTALLAQSKASLTMDEITDCRNASAFQTSDETLERCRQAIKAKQEAK